MINTALKGKTIFITGGSRGIGREIALKAARNGANIVIASKTADAHSKLPGTIFSVAKEVEEAGGRALPLQVDVRVDEQVEKAVASTVAHFGGIDIVINNASAIWRKPVEETPMKRYDLMNSVNARGTYATTQACLPHLIASAKKGNNPHVLMLSPPLNLDPKWFKNSTAYTIAKYGMSMCVLGFSEEFKSSGIAVNALWPRTLIATAAIEYIFENKESLNNCRKPEIVSDAAFAILTKDSRKVTGNFFIDDEVLKAEGLSEADLEKYAVVPGAELEKDFFLD